MPGRIIISQYNNSAQYLLTQKTQMGTQMFIDRVRTGMVRIIRWLEKHEGFWFPAVKWLLDRLFRTISIGYRLNACFDKKSLGGPWVSEFYQFLWVLIGLCWIAVIEWPVLTCSAWIVLGLIVVFYRVFEILLFSIHWLLVAEGPVESYRRSLLAFLLNLCEVSIFFAIAYLLLGCVDPLQGAWSVLFEGLRSVFSLKTASTQCNSCWSQGLPGLQLIISWVLVALIVANLVSAISRGEKTKKKGSDAV